ncbi:MAG: DUF5681 domain-containing protein [Acidobacteriia bacterium]|nr:DUF5681 domain-containing protein [Terriglobia bacterium]
MKNPISSGTKQKRLGGVTGHGFLPGRSGNPKGRPRVRGLLNALKAKVQEAGPDGRSIEEHLVDVLVGEALNGKNRLPALEEIFNRLEGRAHQTVAISDFTQEMSTKSDAELEFHLRNNRWPTDEEKPLLLGTDAKPFA